MKLQNYLAPFIALFLLLPGVDAQQEIKDYFLGPYATSPGEVYRNMMRFDYASYERESTELMTSRVILNANNTLIAKTWDPTLLNFQIYLINNIINSARLSSGMYNNDSHRDNYLGWLDIDNAWEYSLYESYAFVFITQFLYMLQEKGWNMQSQEQSDWWDGVLHFIEEHQWKKWGERSYHRYAQYIRTRTYMGAHWATIAMYLKEMTEDEVVRQECIEVQGIYDILLRRNLKLNPNHPNAYIWNGSWDDVSGVGVDGIEPEGVELQDVGHGNHVVSYIICAYEKGDEEWTFEDIERLCNTAKDIIYDPVTNNFVRNIDGTDTDLDNGSSAYGNVGDAWVKLSKYDPGVEAVMKQFVENYDKYRFLYQPILFAAFFYEN